MKYIKSYWGAGLSVIAVALFFFPWVIDPSDWLGVQIASLLWFLFAASVIFFVNLVVIVLMVKKKNPSWKHYAISNGIMVMCFAVTYIAANSGCLAIP
jgi:hypothetical protein